MLGVVAEADVIAGEAGEFGDTQAGLDREGEHHSIPPALPATRVGRCQQGVDLSLVQELDDPFVETFGRDRQDPLDE